MPRILALQALPLNIRLRSALTWGKGHELRQLEHVLLRVQLDDGTLGFAEAPPRPSIYGETVASIRAVLAEQLAPLLLGQSVRSFADVAALSSRMDMTKNNHCAKGALDMALHQALATSRGQALSSYLGSSSRHIRLSSIVSTGSAATVCTDVAATYDAGLRVFKVKIGRDLERECELLKALLATFPGAQFYVDANETLAEGEAAALLQRLHDLGVLFCEEPLPVQQIGQRRRLRQACTMPLIADDSAFTLPELQREIDFCTFDILNIKPARSGFSQSRAMLELALAAGKSVMVGSQASSLLGCLHAAVLAGQPGVACPSECSFYLKTRAALDDAPPIVDGDMALPAVDASLARLQAQLARQYPA